MVIHWWQQWINNRKQQETGTQTKGQTSRSLETLQTDRHFPNIEQDSEAAKNKWAGVKWLYNYTDHMQMSIDDCRGLGFKITEICDYVLCQQPIVKGKYLYIFYT